MRGTLYRFAGSALSLPVAAWLLPGVHTQNAVTAWLAGLILALIYLVIRPVAKLILTPFNCLTFGILGFVVDALFVLLAASWMPGFAIDGFWWAVATAMIAEVIRGLAGMFAGKD